MRDCSLVPIAVQCPAGEVCKFRSLAAGGDHTCAVDTNGKAWCWGEDGSLATGDSSLGALPKHTHRRIPAFTDLGVPADFVAIDTDFTHTCAVSAAQDVFCWGDNFFGQLGAPLAIPSSTSAQLVRSGNRYKSIVDGHVAFLRGPGQQRTGGLLGRQLALSAHRQRQFRQSSSRSIRKCRSRAEACSSWLRARPPPARRFRTTTRSAGASRRAVRRSTALHRASSRCPLRTLGASPPTSTDCNGFQNCARICVTDLGGELSCGHWKAGAPPQQLSQIPDPKGVVVISWTQVDVGPNHVCAVTTRGDVWCFGDNSWGQFGTGAWSSTRTDEPVTAANR